MCSGAPFPISPLTVQTGFFLKEISAIVGAAIIRPTDRGWSALLRSQHLGLGPREPVVVEIPQALSPGVWYPLCFLLRAVKHIGRCSTIYDPCNVWIGARVSCVWRAGRVSQARHGALYFVTYLAVFTNMYPCRANVGGQIHRLLVVE